MPLRLDPSENARFRRSCWAAFFAAPALIAFSLVAAADKWGDHDRWRAADLFYSDWCLAPFLSAAAILTLHPTPKGRWWKAIAAFAAAIPAYRFAFAAFAFAGMMVGLDM